MKKILILASNPKHDLNLAREIRDLKGVVERSVQREQFEVEIALAVRPSDLHELLFSTKPQIVHFCGHGTGSAGLVLEDDSGKELVVKTEALSDLFRLFALRGVECVLLNACYSEVQAEAFVQHVDSVIGMKQEIRDDAAIAFATGFYQALGFECSIAEAFEFGCNAIQLHLSGGGARSTTEAIRKAEVVGVVQTVVIPEHLKPILKQKPQSTPRSTALLAVSPSAIQFQVDQALEKETALKQYREQVRGFLTNRALSEIEKIRLKQLRQQLGLTVEDTDRILAEEQIPIHKGQQAYRDLLIELIHSGCYPFSDAIQTELKQFQQECNLTDLEASAISTPILASAQLQPYEFEVVTLTLDGKPAARTLHQAKVFTNNLADGVVLEMVSISGGTFLMGSPLEEEGRSEEESPQHQVSIAPFFVSKYPITQAQWRAVAALPQVELHLNPNPAQFIGENRPVEQISWYEAIEFCQRLAQKTGRPYRLLSEAEWEYACRAGTTTPFHFGSSLSTDFANFNGNYVYGLGTKGKYRQETSTVETGAANAFGLHDMHGNVWEWCADLWHPSYEGAPTDGSVWMAGGDESRRILRGGSWFYDPWDCRSAYRVGGKADYKDCKIGFRVSCSSL